jgi:hypothetical protein
VEKELDYMRVRTGDKRREGSLTPVQLNLRRSHSTEVHSTSNPTSPRRPMTPVVTPINLAAILSAADGNEAALTAKDEASSDASVDGGDGSAGSNPATASSTPRDANKEEEAVGEQAKSEATVDFGDDDASASAVIAEVNNALEEEKEEQQPPQETDAKQAMRVRL